MKILVISNMYPNEVNPSYGVFVEKFCNQLDMIGVEYDTVLMTKGTGTCNKIIKYFKFYFLSFCKCLFKKYDIVYVHYASHSSIGVLAAAKIKRITIFTNLHGSDVIPENSIQKIMQIYTKALVLKSKRIIVPSEYFKNLILEKYSINFDKVFVYPSAGIDSKIFHPLNNNELKPVRQKLNLNTKYYTFGMIGRISYNKGWDTFVDAIKIVCDKGYKANFIIVGDGKETTLLESKIKMLNLTSYILFLKKLIPQSELVKFYSVIDWLIFPTKREGESLGLVAIESMACGTPVIASDYAAPRYYVNDGVNGYKFQMGNANDLARLIMRVIDEQDDKKAYMVGVNETAQDFFEESIYNKLLNILDLDMENSDEWFKIKKK